MNDVKLGKLIDWEAARDAVHIAIAPVTANEKLFPGQEVGVLAGLARAMATQKVGIVDPFLKGPVFVGQRFYVVLFPGTITGLRHAWEHPAFPAEQSLPSFADVIRGEHGEKAQSELWLRQYAKDLNCYDGPDEAYRRLMDDLCSGALSAHGTDLYGYGDLDSADELQRHAEVVLGRPVNLRAFSFSCSC